MSANAAAPASTVNRTAVRVTPLSGATEGGAPCHLLEIDGCTLLLDCGWDEGRGAAGLEPLRALAGRIDAVLISHADMAHVGGLPYAVRALGLSAPVYATLPVAKLGLMTLYDFHQVSSDGLGRGWVGRARAFLWVLSGRAYTPLAPGI